MNKLNAYEKHNDLTIDERRMQLIYLANDKSENSKHLNYEEIGDLVGYAPSTVRNYIWKFSHLLEEACKKFCSVVKEIILGIVEKVPILFAKGTKLCYLFKFYDGNGDLLFSKVGTTERTIKKRISEEINYYNNHGIDVWGATIESVFDTGDLEPEGAQDYVKSYYIKKYRNTYIKNDRFRCDLDVNEFNELISNYLCAQGLTKYN